MFTYRQLSLGGLAAMVILAVALYPFSNVTVAIDVLGSSLAMLPVFGGLYLLLRMLLRHHPADGMTKRGQDAVWFAQHTLELLMVWTVFPVLETVTTYLVAPLGRDLADGRLASFDRAIGIRTQQIVAWFTARPRLDAAMDRVYAFMIPQVGFLAVYFLVWRRNVDRIWEAFALIVCGAGTGIAFLILMPATGPILVVEHALKPGQQLFLDHFAALRSGEPFYMDSATGIITFPSFHAYIALVVAWAFRDEKYLVVPMFVLNALICVATLSTGWHYAADVIAGIAWLAAWIVTLRALTRPAADGHNAETAPETTAAETG